MEEIDSAGGKTSPVIRLPRIVVRRDSPSLRARHVCAAAESRCLLLGPHISIEIPLPSRALAPSPCSGVYLPQVLSISISEALFAIKRKA